MIPRACVQYDLWEPTWEPPGLLPARRVSGDLSWIPQGLYLSMIILME